MDDEYDMIVDALVAGDLRKLNAFAATVIGFPNGEDGFIGRRWIRNAVDVGCLSAIEWMLSERVDLDFRECDGYTPLHAALDRDSDVHAVLEMLLTAGAPVNAKGINDWTPAHMAAARDDVESLRILIRFGADLSIRTDIDDYATPLEEARILGKHQAVRFLESFA